MGKPKAKIARILKLFLLSSLVFAGPAGALFSQDCQGCRRTAILQDVENLEFGTIRSLLVQALTTPCFHLQDLETVIAYRERAKREGWSFLVKESKWNPPEYTLTARYETGLEETVKSRLVVTLLFHDGETITEWVTESTNTNFTYGGHINRMFRNPTAEMKKGPPIQTLLAEFEAQPLRCTVSPSSPRADLGAVVNIGLSAFLGMADRPAKPFNRIVVQVLEGEIENGRQLSIDPALRAFALEDGQEITVRYRAPSKSGKQRDTLRVYNSCGILPAAIVPLEQTPLGAVIAEAAIELERSEEQPSHTRLNPTRRNLSPEEYAPLVGEWVFLRGLQDETAHAREVVRTDGTGEFYRLFTDEKPAATYTFEVTGYDKKTKTYSVIMHHDIAFESYALVRVTGPRREWLCSPWEKKFPERMDPTSDYYLISYTRGPKDYSLEPFVGTWKNTEPDPTSKSIMNPDGTGVYHFRGADGYEHDRPFTYGILWRNPESGVYYSFAYYSQSQWYFQTCRISNGGTRMETCSNGPNSWWFPAEDQPCKQLHGLSTK